MRTGCTLSCDPRRRCANGPVASVPVLAWEMQGAIDRLERVMKRHTLAFTTMLAAALTSSPRGAASVGSRPARERLSSPEPACQAYVGEPRDATSVAFRWDQQLSLAACRVAVHIAPIERGDVGALPGLVATLEAAFAPSIAIYRDAMSLGPPDVKILGAYHLGATYLAIVVRARNAIAPDDERSRQALDRLLALDLRAALAAFDEVGFLAEDDTRAARSSSIVKLAIVNARTSSEQLRR